MLHDRSRVEERALLVLIVYGVVLALAALAYVYARSRRISAALRSSQDLNERLEAEISERKAAETTLRRTQTELAQSERLAALGRLAASVTHELGQPLSAMRNYLAAADVTGETADLSDRLEPVVNRMETTTKQLRAFARQGDDALSAIDLCAVISGAIDLIAHDFQAAGVKLGFEAPVSDVRDEKRLLRFQKQMATVELLIIDELGFVPLSKTGAELLFELISQRYERGATIITSNLPFDEWTATFGEERLTGALLDRLTHHVHILEMNAQSYRLAQSKARKAG